MNGSRWIRWSLRAGLTLTSLALCFVALELALRVASGEPLIPSENLIARKVALLRVHVSNEYDPLLGWVLKPNMDSPGGVSTLAYGIRRNGPGPQPILDGAILTSGDSFTAGSEVLDHESWPAYLEQRLGMPTLNAAAGAWGSDQIVLRVEQLVPIVHPSMVVVSFLVDDLQRSRYRVYAGGNKPYFTIADGELVHHNHPVPPFSGRRDELGPTRSILGHSLLVSWTMERVGYSAWWRDGSVYKRARHVDVVAVNTLLMKRLKRALDAQGISLTFLMQYGGSQVAEWGAQPDYALQVLENFRALGVDCVNTWEPLQEIYTQQGEEALKALYVMHEDGKVYGHMSGAGNQFIAALLAARMEPRARAILAERAAAPGGDEPGPDVGSGSSGR
jgi:hypothetical protein